MICILDTQHCQAIRQPMFKKIKNLKKNNGVCVCVCSMSIRPILHAVIKTDTNINQHFDCVGYFRLNNCIQLQQGIGVAQGFVVKAFACYECLTAVLLSASESRFKLTL